MKKLNIPILIIFISSLFYSGCISFMATKNQFSGYRKDKIKQVKVYYAENLNTIGMQLDGKIKTLGNKGEYYLTFNLDTLKPEILSNLNYDSKSNSYKYAYILHSIKGSGNKNKSCIHNVRFYRHALEKEEFNTNHFKLLYSADKKDIEKLEDLYNKKMLAKFTLDTDQDKELEQLNIYLFKEQRYAWWKNLYLIVTIPLDLATLPIQVVAALIIIK